MMFELPVVATQWRGIPSIVDDRRTGLLVPIRDVKSTGKALEELVTDVALRHRYGREGRLKYEATYQVKHFFKNISYHLANC